MKSQISFLFLLSLFTPLPAQDEEKAYQLAVKNPPLPVPSVFKVTEKGAMKDVGLEFRIQDNIIKGAMAFGSREEVEYEFLAQDRIRATVLTDRAVGKRSIGANEEEFDESKATEGMAFLLTLKGEEWSAVPEADEIKAVDREEVDERIESLQRDFDEKVDEDLAIYGEKPRRVGETWDVDPKAVPGMGEIEVMGGEMSMTLLKVEKFQGEDCAVLKAKVKVTGLMEQGDMKGVGVDLEGTLSITRSLTHFLDYKVSGEMDMVMSGPLQLQPGMNANLKAEGEMTLNLVARKQPARKAEEKDQ